MLLNVLFDQCSFFFFNSWMKCPFMKRENYFNVTAFKICFSPVFVKFTSLNMEISFPEFFEAAERKIGYAFLVINAS